MLRPCVKGRSISVAPKYCLLAPRRPSQERKASLLRASSSSERQGMRTVGVTAGDASAQPVLFERGTDPLRPPALIRNPSANGEDVSETGMVPANGLWAGRLMAQKRTTWADYFHLQSAIRVDGEVTAVRTQRHGPWDTTRHPANGHAGSCARLPRRPAGLCCG